MGIVTSRQATEEFIGGDPFMLHGVVCSWRVRPRDQFPTGPDDRTVSGDGGERGAAVLERYWPQLVRVWPAYERFYRQGGRRSVFVLDPTTAAEPQPADQRTP
jgi:hypothetical protein